jgi:thiopeptide-type bacteriocin biosynthesis protein
VQFKNVVLSPARWLIPEIFTSAGDTADTGRTTEFRRWLGDNNIHLFSYGPGDQKLIFDADNNGDLDAFLAIVKGKARSYIAESIPLLKGLVGDSENRSYNAEFIWIFYHENQLYRSLPETSSPDGHFPKTRYLPGQEWLYFEIYCHYATSNRILTSYLAKFITAHRRMITQWFFIRYNSPSYHIRLRVKLRDLRDGYPMMSALSSILEEAMLSGIIPDIQLKPYVREVERYGASQIAKAENFFFRNSSLILKVISMDFSAGERYGLSICLMESILEESDYGYPERLAFYTRMEQGFATEFSMTTQAFKKLNEGFASFSKQSKDFAVEKRIGSNQWRTMKKAFQNCVNSSSPLLKEKMIADLFHMHVNRLFENQQRMHEMIIYSYLKTRLKRKYYAKPGKPR